MSQIQTQAQLEIQTQKPELKALLKVISDKVKYDKHTFSELYQGAALTMAEMIRTQHMTEEQVTNVCSCLLLMYLRLNGGQ